MKLNLETISSRAYLALRELDETYIGTVDYMGIAYFWNYAYRFDLRSATPAKRRRVHAALLAASLAAAGVSPEHDAIILRSLGR